MTLFSETSPDGRHRIKFSITHEMGMGGPQVGHVLVNEHDLGTGFLSSWLWSVNSDKVLLISPISRNPDESASFLYDVNSKALFECEETFGFSIPVARFDGQILVYENPSWGECRITPKTRVL
jgi:hypothetical protein